MILEIAMLDVIPTQTIEFEKAFAQAQRIISQMPGYVTHELQRCLEKESRYALLITWQTLEDHTISFRQSPAYQEW
jgi:heme-degrading monooxygenase HmoA